MIVPARKSRHHLQLVPAEPNPSVTMPGPPVLSEYFDSDAELMRRRYPPTGDPELWVRYGPAGPPGWDGPVEMLMAREVDAEAAARWAATGSSEPT